jgi:hypothetical protein
VRFPSLQEGMKGLLASEMEKVVREEKWVYIRITLVSRCGYSPELSEIYYANADCLLSLFLITNFY